MSTPNRRKVPSFANSVESVITLTGVRHDNGSNYVSGDFEKHLLVVTRQEPKGAKADFVSRYFNPGAVIPEDPVTGFIHSTLVPYWVARLGRNALMAYQASKRRGWLESELTENRVLLGGNAAVDGL